MNRSFTVCCILIIVVLCATPFCNAQNNSDAQVFDSTNEEKTSLQKGMDPIFELYHNFLDTVMPYNFYDDSEAPFSVQDIITITKNEDYSRLQDDWQDLVKTFGGFAACMICGLLFIIFMPIVGCVYCCCSCCCHKCTGTREEHDPKHAKCKRVTYTTLLLIFTTLMLAGAIITFLGADLLHRSLKNEDGKGLIGGLDTSIDHMQDFVNDTLKDIEREAKEKIIDQGLNGILKSITDTAITTVTRVKNVINATSLLNQADSIGAAAQTVLTDLQTIENTLTNLTDLQDNVTTTLSNVKSDVNTACASLPAACVNIDLNNLTFQPNFTSLERLQDELSKVQEANNITGLVEEARKEFDKVSNDVNNTVDGEISTANDKIDELTDTISRELKNLDGISQQFVNAMDDGKSFTSDEQETIETVGNYIWYSCIGMACAVLLVVVFYYLGVLFGLCGERPSPDAACCNKGTGSNLICAGICFSFLFCWILMLVVILTFTLGGLSYTMACKYLNDGVEHVDTFESVVSEGFGWNISSTFNTTNLTIAGMFRNCKENQGVYTALNLKYLFDIDEQLNVDAVEDEVRKIINSTNINISSIKLLSPGLRQQLEDFTASNISSVNYTEYIVEADKALFSTDLGSIITQLLTAANQSTDSNLNATLRKAATDLQVVRDVVQPAIETEIASLKTSVRNLENNSNVTAQVSSLIDNIEQSETDFNDNSSLIVQDQLRLAGEGILDTINTVVNNTKDDIKHNIGRCRSLYDAANSLVHSTCVVTLDPLNAIWFGLGWSLFFYIPSFIFAALLGSLYKRPEKYVEERKPDFDSVSYDYGTFDGRSHVPYSGYDNGYNGGRNEEHYPLTSVDNNRSRDKVGSNNYAYEGRDYEQGPRYHRDGHSAQRGGYHGQGASGEGRGPAYARPYAGSQEPYDGYERTPPPRYDDVTSHGRPRGDHGGYPKLRNY